MSIPIRMRQSTTTPVPTSLLSGEIAAYLTSSAATVFMGDSNGVPRMVGGSNVFLPLAGGTLTGQAKGIAPVAPEDLTRKDYVDTQVATRLTQAQGDARYLRLTGGAMTGALTLAADPTVALGASTKQYVDTQVATRLTQAQANALYALVVHTHVESQITNLNRTRWRGAWLSGSYVVNDMVTLGGYTYVCTVDTSVAPPSAGWTVMGSAGASVKSADTAPATPAPGDLWYRTSGEAGLFMWYVDVDSAQWISIDQSSAYFANMLQLVGGTMTGLLQLTPNPTIPVALAISGTFASAAITIPANQAFALDTAGTITMRFNSTLNAIEFARSGVVKSSIPMA